MGPLLNHVRTEGLSLLAPKRAPAIAGALFGAALTARHSGPSPPWSPACNRLPSPDQRDTLFRLFLNDARSFVVVDLNQAIAQEAAVLLLTAPATVRPRPLAALHVASAKWAFARARRR